jgi:hypothetical protein
MTTMDKQGRTQLRKSLLEALHAETQQNALSAHGRVLWLTDQLGEYIERWIGFCAIPSLPMPALLDSSLFRAVEVGAEVLGEAMQDWDATPSARSAWDTFTHTLADVRHASDRQQTSRLKETFNPFRAALGFSNRQGPALPT